MVLAVVAALSALGVWRLYESLVTTARGQVVDKRLSERVAAASEAPGGVLDLVSVGSLLLVLAVAVGVALLRRRPDLAAAAALIVVAANVTTQVLKDSLDRPGLGLGTLNSFPSGHTTVTASLAAAVVVVVPGLARLPALLAGVGATAWIGAATIVSGWHRVSDIVAAVLVVLGWTAVALLLARRRVSAAGPAEQPAGSRESATSASGERAAG